MTNLRKFGFFSNKIKVVHRDIRNLRNLVKLDLSNNQIKELPDEICELAYLNWLNLSNNKLEMLHKEINKLVYLEELGLGLNKLKKLPRLDKLQKLRILPIFKNELKEINSTIKYCKSIEKLDFSDNEIEELPYFLINMVTLRYLNLKGNRIKKIEVNKIEYMKSHINMIDLSENKLEMIPYKFFKIFSNITTIKISDNPYNVLENEEPEKVTLLEKCYNRILNLKYDISPNINMIFKKIRLCGICEGYYVNGPYKIYVKSNIYEEEFFMFVVEKYCCSIICYNREMKRKNKY